jgi:hypothetical protein
MCVRLSLLANVSYYDPIGVGKVNKLFYWLTGGFPSEEGLNRVGSWNHPL